MVRYSPLTTRERRQRRFEYAIITTVRHSGRGRMRAFDLQPYVNRNTTLIKAIGQFGASLGKGTSCSAVLNVNNWPMPSLQEKSKKERRVGSVYLGTWSMYFDFTTILETSIFTFTWLILLL